MEPKVAQPEEELVDYDEDDTETTTTAAAAAAAASTDAVKTDGADEKAEKQKGSYAGVHTSGFRDFLLKPELLQALRDSGFEHPSEVQHECIPQACLGSDVICQAKSGMGKTAVFVIATLQQLEAVQDNTVDTLVLCHTRELAYQICREFERFSKHMPDVKVAVFYGGVPIAQHKKLLKQNVPHIVVATPGRALQLVNEGDLKIDKVKRFVIDECDKILDTLDMRRDVQAIMKRTPHDKQVMLFSATISENTRKICRKFTQDAIEVFVDDESKLTLHGLVQHYVKLGEKEKNRKLADVLDFEFNQAVVFVKSCNRATQLSKLLVKNGFTQTQFIHSDMKQEDRIKRYNEFKEYKFRILVTTDVFGRGVDIERVNLVVNYDFPRDSDSYLHRVGRAGRFGTKGLAVSFVSTEEDVKILEEIQSRFEVDIKPLPQEGVDASAYMSSA